MLFLIIMIPNFIWFLVSAPNDILRTESITEILDTMASVCQVLMIIFLCIFINKEHEMKKRSRWIVAVIICCLLYFISLDFTITDLQIYLSYWD